MAFNAGIQSASGYAGDINSTPLARIGYYNGFIARYYERDFIPEIVNSNIDERITRCNQTVQIMKAIEVGPWRPYQKNQDMIPNQVNNEAICLSICNAVYNDFKFDETDIYFACERWDQYEDMLLDAVYESYAAFQRDWVLTAMVLEASPMNKGHNAGPHGKIDLGASGNPVVVDKDNLALQISFLQNVLKQQLQWRSGDMFLVVPPDLQSLLMTSNYANAAWTGSCAPCSTGIDGLWDRPLGGFKIIETVHAPFAYEQDGRLCYYIIAGNSSAFAYASDIIEGRIVKGIRTFSAEYQMLAVWGGAMIYPEGIAVAYWHFNYS